MWTALLSWRECPGLWFNALYFLFLSLLCNIIEESQLQPNTSWMENCVWLVWAFALCNFTTGVWSSQGICCMWAVFDVFFLLWVLLEKTHWVLQCFLSISLPWLKAGCMCVDHYVMPRSSEAAQEQKRRWKRRELIEFHPLSPFTFISLGGLQNSHFS